jgi:hypothetical protein
MLDVLSRLTFSSSDIENVMEERECIECIEAVEMEFLEFFKWPSDGLRALLHGLLERRGLARDDRRLGGVSFNQVHHIAKLVLMPTYRGGRGPFYSSLAPVINMLTLVIIAAQSKAVLQSHERSEGSKLPCENHSAKIEITGCCLSPCEILLAESEC